MKGMKSWRNLAEGIYKWEEVFGTFQPEPQVKQASVVIYGQGKGFECQLVNVVVGILKNKWENGIGIFSFEMDEHVIFQGESWQRKRSGPKYIITRSIDPDNLSYCLKPPQNGGWFCPSGFEIFAEFNLESSQDTLKMLGYGEAAIKQAQNIVEGHLRFPE